MNVSDVSSTCYVAPSSATQAQTPTTGATGAQDQNGDGGRVHHHGHHHGGGRMGGAVMQALQSLGVSLPQPNGSSPGQPSGHDGDADDANRQAAGSSIRADTHQFMHALFQAVRGESASASADATATSSGGSTDRRVGFSSDLSALIAQVGNGSAPSDLQSAFSQLMSDLGAQGGAAATSADAATGAASTSAASAGSVTLLQLLTQMQQQLGYGPASTQANTGNVVGTTA